MPSRALQTVLIALSLMTGCVGALPPYPPAQPRLLVLTDIGGDPDDQQSMRRLMLYSHAFRIVGLVASASGTPGELGENAVQPDLIRAIVADYAAVRDNLLLHHPGYPDADSLYAVIKAGSPQRGVDFIGPDGATEGSNHIIDAVDAATPEDPVYLAIWGGAHDLAQALFDVRAGRDSTALDAFLSRLRVYAIGDQDGYNTEVNGERRDVAGTGLWIKTHFPALRYVETNPPEINRFAALFRGMYQNDSRGGGYPVVPLVDDATAALNQEAWVEANVRTGHGPLGDGYPITNQNPSTERNTRGVKEGDTPSWFFALPNGLMHPEHPEWGGWGGRFQPDGGNHYIDAEDRHPAHPGNAGVGHKWTVARWREAYQNDFAARMDWCVQPFDEANHRPQVILDGDLSPAYHVMQVALGASITLDASATYDPDSDSLSYRWWLYEEPSEYDGVLEMETSDQPMNTVFIPEDAGGKQLHLILEVTDDGEPPLTGYRRTILDVQDGENG